MKLHIIGNNGPYPAKGAACSCYLLSSDSGNTNIIIDFGTGALEALSGRIDYDRISAVILSHLHFDHMSDMLPMQYALQFHPRSALPVFAPQTPEKVHAVLEAPCYECSRLRTPCRALQRKKADSDPLKPQIFCRKSYSGSKGIFRRRLLQ